MVIFDAAVEPGAIQAVIDRTIETVRTSGGNPGALDRWGKRSFAYEVNHKREGYYVILEFTSEPKTVAELDRLLTLADEVVRHKVVRIPDAVAGRKAVAAAAAAGATVSA
jgi:small subunit ribosomal protein S6